MLRELGLGMLFLLAGYEVEVDELVGRGGRRALATWLVCLGVALAVIGLIGLSDQIHAEIAVAIALTSTALGTLLPILKDSGMLGTRFGRTLMNHGAYGELGPIVAMAVLLGARGPVGSLVVLGGVRPARGAACTASRCGTAARARRCSPSSSAVRRRPVRPRCGWWCCCW